MHKPDAVRDSFLFRAARAVLMPVWILYTHWRLIRQFSRREISEKYRQTFLGLFWFVLTPLLYLTAFSLVFGYILPGRRETWAHLQGTSELDFVVAIFSGLIVYWLFNETVVQSTNLMPRHRNLVTELKFPTEILMWSSIFTSLFGFFVHLIFFVVLYVLWIGPLPWTMLLLPIVLLPLLVMLMGLGWILAAFSALVRDISQLAAVGVTAMLFVSGVFFPATIVPGQYRELFLLNPVARSIDDVRALLFEQSLPVWHELGVYMLISSLVMLLGFRIFKRLQPRFAEHL
jgi:lipopolysaccharide transport system permease protein